MCAGCISPDKYAIFCDFCEFFLHKFTFSTVSFASLPRGIERAPCIKLPPAVAMQWARYSRKSPQQRTSALSDTKEWIRQELRPRSLAVVSRSLKIGEETSGEIEGLAEYQLGIWLDFGIACSA